MSVLKQCFDKSVNQYSPVIGDVERKVSYDEEGNEVITYEPVDYASIVASHGTADMWSLDAMLKAGINPQTSIRTSFATRLEGVNQIKGIDVDTLIDQITIKDVE